MVCKNLFKITRSRLLCIMIVYSYVKDSNFFCEKLIFNLIKSCLKFSRVCSNIVYLCFKERICEIFVKIRRIHIQMRIDHFIDQIRSNGSF